MQQPPRVHRYNHNKQLESEEQVYSFENVDDLVLGTAVKVVDIEHDSVDPRKIERILRLFVFRAFCFSNPPPLAQLSECSVVCCGVKLFLYFRLIDDYPIGSLDDVPGTDPLEVLELFLARLQFVLRRDESPFLFRKHVTSARHRRQQPGLRRCWVGSFRKLEIIIDGPRQTLEDIGYQTRPQIALLIAPRVEFDLNNVVAIR